MRRLRTLKRKKEEKESTKNQVKLERVLGLTVTSNASLATAPATGQLLTKTLTKEFHTTPNSHDNRFNLIRSKCC